MTFNYDTCPLLRDRNIGLSMMGYHQTGCGDIEVDNQEVIDVCLECAKNPCFYECKGEQRREMFGKVR